MKRGWEEKKLVEVCQIRPGKKEASERLKETDYVTFLPMEDLGVLNKVVHGAKKKQLKDVAGSYTYFAENDVLLAKITPCFENGKIGIARNLINGVGFGSSEYIVFRSRRNIDPEFLYYFLSRSQFRDEGKKHMSGAVGHKRVSKEWIENYLIPLPPLPEQKRIVAILDEAFEAILKAKANAEQNLKNSKELFESYLQEVFDNKGEDWVENILEDIADVEYGYTDKATENGYYRYIRITDIDKNGELILEDKKYISRSKEAEKFIAKDKDLLMARTGATFAKVLLFNDHEASVFASYLIRIKFKVKIENELYWYFAKTKKYWDQANSLQSGSAQPHFNGAAVKKMVFTYPKSVKLQKQLIEKFQILSTKTKKLEAIYQKKINELEVLKKTILQKAFSGELTSASVGVA